MMFFFIICSKCLLIKVEEAVLPVLIEMWRDEREIGGKGKKENTGKI